MIKRTICQICKCDCGAIAEVENDKVVRIFGDRDDPNSMGKLCVKGRNYTKVLYHPNRIKKPLLNVGKRGSPEWKEISWEKALDIIAEKLLELKREGLEESLVFLHGPSARIVDRSVVKRFANIFGTPNVTGSWAYCVGSMVLASQLLLGFPYPICDFENSKLIVLWGANPAVSKVHRYGGVFEEIVKAKRKGAKVIVIDPRRSESAKIADIHIRVRPGSDIYLALGILNRLIKKELHNAEFVEKHVLGFEKLRREVEKYTPDFVEKKTDVPRELIEIAAELIGKVKPASIDFREGILHSINGFQTARAILSIAAITGNVDVKGGIIRNPSVKLNDITLKEPDKKPFWKDKFPLAKDGSAYLSEAILSDGYPVKVLIVFKSNPVLTLPNSKRFIEALERIELIVVHDIFLTATCKYADVVLPASTFLEKAEIDAVPLKKHRWVRVKRRVVNPVGEAKSEVEFVVALAKKLGYEKFFPYSSEEDVIRELLRGSEVEKYSVEELEKGVRLDNPIGEMRKSGFPTPSGKIELFPEILEKVGAQKFEILEEDSEEFPYYLITGARVLPFYHSQFRNVESLVKLNPEPIAEVGVEIARNEGISNGDFVEIETKFGNLKVKAAVNKDLHPLTVSVPHGWEESNANFLTGSVFDPLSGAPMYRGIKCNVRKVHESS